jgi:glucose/arabinose dehydrogenase
VRRWLIFCAAIFLASACAGASAPSAPGPGAAIPAGDALPWPLTLPPGYRISLYARGLEEVRDIAFSPSGVPYVTVMNRGGRRAGKVLALPDQNGDGRADRAVVVTGDLDKPHGIVFYKDQLYVSEASTIWLLRDSNGDMVADTREAVVEEIPASGDHWARPFLFDEDGSIMVAIGSHCNACQEGDKRRATIARFQPGVASQRGQVIARGLRSVVGLTWRPGTHELWATNNGRDQLGPETPADQLFRIEEGKHYGWPYCYGDRTPDPEIFADPNISTPDRTPKNVFCREQVTAPALLLPPHTAPLGLVFYDGAQFPPEARGSLFVALHGAFDFSTRSGYRVVRISFVDGQPGQPEDFITGWVPPDAKLWLGRPVGVRVGPQGSLFVTDDVNGFLYRVDYVGT